MLILTRRKGESVDMIDRDTDTVLATITLLELLPNGTVRLGFEAPDYVRIIRDNAVRREEGNGHESNEG